MTFPIKPVELNLSPLEERLVSPRIPFMQIHSKPCGGQLSIVGNVVNVPANVNQTVHCLPRTLNDSETIQIKLKRKRSFKHHVSYESVRPNKVLKAAQWLLENSPIYQNEGITLNPQFSHFSEICQVTSELNGAPTSPSCPSVSNAIDDSSVAGNQPISSDNYVTDDVMVHDPVLPDDSNPDVDLCIGNTTTESSIAHNMVVDRTISSDNYVTDDVMVHDPVLPDDSNPDVDLCIGNTTTESSIAHNMVVDCTISSDIDVMVHDPVLPNVNIRVDHLSVHDKTTGSFITPSITVNHIISNNNDPPNDKLDNDQVLSEDSSANDSCIENNNFINTSQEDELNQSSVSSKKQCDESADNWSEDDEVLPPPETMVQNVNYGEFTDILEFAPGEGNKPVSIFHDENAEFLAFPTIYCGETIPPKSCRKIPVHYSTVCKWQARHVDRRVAKHVPNLFFKVKRLQVKQLRDKVSIAVRKIKGQRGQKLTAGHLLQPGTIESLVKLNDGYRVLRTLRGSPAYWEQTKKDLFAMIRQLGLPTFFLSLSSAETKWIPLLKTLAKLIDDRDLQDDEITIMSWAEKCRLIRSDPITCARYYDHKLSTFIKKMLQNELAPIGKVADYFGRIEFQSRGSAHCHMLIWIENAPIYGINEDDEVTAFHDKYITCSAEMTPLTSLQIHKHTRTCRKAGRAAVCRFNYPLPPMPETKILEPLPNGCRALHKNNYDKISKHLREMPAGNQQTFEEFLKDLDMTYADYEDAIRYPLAGVKVFLKRNTHETRINAYNPVLLNAWEANMDIQFVLDPYACAAYIVSYMTKGQRGMSRLLHEACEEVRRGVNKDIRQQVRHIGNTFLSAVEICAQEAAWLVLQLPMRKTSRSFCFINTSRVEERTFMLKTNQQLTELPSSSTAVESDNIIKRYTRRPKCLEDMCLADFAAYFDICHTTRGISKANNRYDSYLPEDMPPDDNLDDAVVEQDETSNEESGEIACMDDELDDIVYTLYGGLTIKKRNSPKIIRYVKFSKIKEPENYYRELLMLFHPWRYEGKIMGTCSTYKDQFNLVKSKVILNQSKYEKNADILNSLEDIPDNEISGEPVAPNCQHMNELQETQKHEYAEYGCFDPDLHNTALKSDIGQDLGLGPQSQTCSVASSPLLPDDQYRALIRKLNAQQRYFYDHVIHYLKTKSEPLYNFLTGGAGVGKSMVTRALYETLVRFYDNVAGSNPDEIKVLLCAPTGKAAFNIKGSTLHSAFHIRPHQSLKYTALSDHEFNNLHNRFRNLKVVFIDEISMVGKNMFNYINLRLQEIMRCSQPFGGISIVAIGDLYQLQPVMDKWIFEIDNDNYGPLATNLWVEHFTMYQLTEIMRQKDDADFAHLLNRLRTGNHTVDDIDILKSRIISSENANIQSMPHLFVTNDAVDRHNADIFLSFPIDEKVEITAIDIAVGDVSKTVKTRILERVPKHHTKTMGLMGKLPVALNQRVDISINVDVSDGLTNGATGVIKFIDYRVPNSKRCSIIWIKFDCPTVGQNTRSKYFSLYKSGISKTWTPVFEISRQFSVGKNRDCFVLRRQFPISPSGAKTVHKSQGDTMCNAVVHLGSNRRQAHVHYVALSRVQNLQGLHVLDLCDQKICVSSAVQKEMDRLTTRPFRSCIPKMELPNNQHSPVVKVLYLNIRSLHAHYLDLKHDQRCLQADIIAIAETRLTQADTDTLYELDGYNLYHFDYESGAALQHRPYYGLAIYSKYPLTHMNRLTIQKDIQVFSCTFNSGNLAVQLAFLYVPPKYHSLANQKIIFDGII